MSIPIKDQNILWGRAAALCSCSKCRRELVQEKSSNKSRAIIGEMAHIYAKSKSGPRFNPDLKEDFINSYDNLILLCPMHHTIIDKNPQDYPPEILQEMKDKHETWVRENHKRPEGEGIGWTVIIQERDLPIDTDEAVISLLTDFSEGEIIKLKCKTQDDIQLNGKLDQETKIQEIINKSKNKRFAIFSLGFISLAIYLGYLLTSRTRIRYSQFNRDTQSWVWPNIINNPIPSMQLKGLLEKENTDIKEAIIKVSLSSKIKNMQIEEIGLDLKDSYEIYVQNPSEDWLRSEQQILDLSQQFRKILNNIIAYMVNIQKVHLFYAGPTAGAIAIGRQINPNMNPPVQLYEFTFNKRPNYKKSILLGS